MTTKNIAAKDIDSNEAHAIISRILACASKRFGCQLTLNKVGTKQQPTYMVLTKEREVVQINVPRFHAPSPLPRVNVPSSGYFVSLTEMLDRMLDPTSTMSFHRSIIERTDTFVSFSITQEFGSTIEEIKINTDLMI